MIGGLPLILTEWLCCDRSLHLTRCNITDAAAARRASASAGAANTSGWEVSAAVLRWGDEAAATALACEGEGEDGFDLVVGTDLLYFAGAEVTERLCATIAALLAPHEACDAAGPDRNEACGAGGAGADQKAKAKALLGNHSGWFNDSLEECLKASAAAAGLEYLQLPDKQGSRLCELSLMGPV